MQNIIHWGVLMMAVLTGRTRSVFVLAALLLISGCATTTKVKQIDRLAAVDNDNPKVLVMTPDVKYYLLTAGGVPEPHADWTLAARANFETALSAYAKEHNVELVMIPEEGQLDDFEVGYQKLYSAVGNSILVHHFGPMKLPTKQESFDWSLGPGTQTIGEKYDADYALFTYYRDYQASGGRVAFAVLAAAAGVAMSMGSEGGFASLVDLNTGDIVWFNQVAAGAGELRDPDGAHTTVKALFKDLPEG
jgi:hypothetical protein